MSIQRALNDAADRVSDCYDALEAKGGHAVNKILYYAWASAPPDIFYTVNYPPIVGETAYLNAYHKWETSGGNPQWVYTLKAIPSVGDTIYIKSGGQFSSVSAVTSITQIGTDDYDITAVDSTYDAERLGNAYGWELGGDTGFKVQGYYPETDDILIELNGQIITGGTYSASDNIRSQVEDKTLTNLSEAIKTIPQTVIPEVMEHGASAKDTMPLFVPKGSCRESSGHNVSITTPSTFSNEQTSLCNRFSFSGINTLTVSGLTTTGTTGLAAVCYGCKHLTSVSLPDLTTVSASGLYSAFETSTISSFSAPNLTTAGSNNSYAFYNTFYGCTNLETVSFDNLTTAGGASAFYQTFYGCTKLKSLSFPKLTGTRSGAAFMSNMCRGCTSLKTFSAPLLGQTTGSASFNSCFYGCTSLESIDLKGITYMGGTCAQQICSGCTALTSVDFSGLIAFNSGNQSMSSAFQNCPNLTNISFPSMTSIGASTSTYGHFMSAFYASSSTMTYNVTVNFPKVATINCGNSSNSTFKNCNRLSKIYFNKLSAINGSGANYIFSGCNQLTEIHFGAANQATIEAMPGYATLWGRGAGAATVYFDLT